MKQVKRFSTLLFVTLCVVLIGACQSSRHSGGEQTPVDLETTFVTVDGPHFYLGHQRYYFAGTNFWYGAYLGATAQGQARLIKELDLLKSLGVTNLRVLAGSEASNLQMAVSPAFMSAPGEYNENLLQGLDFLLDEMGKRQMKAVLYFTNFWQWSGGMAQLVGWANNEEPLDPDATGRWNEFMQYSAQLYSNEQAQSWLNDYIRELVNRKNTINGKWYKNDTAIMTWELANEPRPGSDENGSANYEAFKAWVDDTAKLIKSLDKNHLVTTGSEGSMGTVRNMAFFEDSHALGSIDYLTFHLWPKNWSWYDAKNPEATFDSALAHTKSYILQHIQVAKRLNKPVVLEEFGLERDAGVFDLAGKTQYRDQFLIEAFALVEQQARLGSPMAGTNFWAWGGYGEAQHADYIWQPGDPFTGDPPQEPQGLNSVFAADKTTLKILRKHGSTMQSLSR